MNGIKCAFFGRVGLPPELRTSAAGKPWARLSVAVGQGEDAERIAVMTAQKLSSSLQKGDRVYVEGTLKLERWTKDGAERSRLSVAAWKCERIGSIGRNKPKRPRQPVANDVDPTGQRQSVPSA
jgi:single-stranded DNA-binding protein